MSGTFGAQEPDEIFLLLQLAKYPEDPDEFTALGSILTSCSIARSFFIYFVRYNSSIFQANSVILESTLELVL